MTKLLGLLLLSTLVFSDIKLPDNFSAEFTQMITNTKQKVINYSGEVRFSDTRLFKWSYLEPTKKEVCINDSELLVVDHDLEQVSAYYINKGIDIVKVFQNAKLHSENIYVAELENKKYTIQLDGEQKLHSIAYYDELDNKVQIVFKEIHYGKGKLPSKEMQCDYPTEYDVIRG